MPFVNMFWLFVFFLWPGLEAATPFTTATTPPGVPTTLSSNLNDVLRLNASKVNGYLEMPSLEIISRTTQSDPIIEGDTEAVTKALGDLSTEGNSSEPFINRRPQSARPLGPADGSQGSEEAAMKATTHDSYSTDVTNDPVTSGDVVVAVEHGAEINETNNGYTENFSANGSAESAGLFDTASDDRGPSAIEMNDQEGLFSGSDLEPDESLFELSEPTEKNFFTVEGDIITTEYSTARNVEDIGTKLVTDRYIQFSTEYTTIVPTETPPMILDVATLLMESASKNYVPEVDGIKTTESVLEPSTYNNKEYLNNSSNDRETISDTSEVTQPSTEKYRNENGATEIDEADYSNKNTSVLNSNPLTTSLILSATENYEAEVDDITSMEGFLQPSNKEYFNNSSNDSEKASKSISDTRGVTQPSTETDWNENGATETAEADYTNRNYENISVLNRNAVTTPLILSATENYETEIYDITSMEGLLEPSNNEYVNNSSNTSENISDTSRVTQPSTDKDSNENGATEIDEVDYTNRIGENISVLNINPVTTSLIPSTTENYEAKVYDITSMEGFSEPSNKEYINNSSNDSEKTSEIISDANGVTQPSIETNWNENDATETDDVDYTNRNGEDISVLNGNPVTTSLIPSATENYEAEVYDITSMEGFSEPSNKEYINNSSNDSEKTSEIISDANGVTQPSIETNWNENGATETDEVDYTNRNGEYISVLNGNSVTSSSILPASENDEAEIYDITSMEGLLKPFNKEYVNNGNNASEKASENISDKSRVIQTSTEKDWNENSATEIDEADYTNRNGENTSLLNRNPVTISLILSATEKYKAEFDDITGTEGVLEPSNKEYINNSSNDSENASENIRDTSGVTQPSTEKDWNENGATKIDETNRNGENISVVNRNIVTSSLILPVTENYGTEIDGITSVEGILELSNKDYISNSSNDSEKVSENISDTSEVTQPSIEKDWIDNGATETHEADYTNRNGENTSILNRNPVTIPLILSATENYEAEVDGITSMEGFLQPSNKEYFNNNTNDSEKASESISDTSGITQPSIEKYWTENGATETEETDYTNKNSENTSVLNKNPVTTSLILSATETYEAEIDGITSVEGVLEPSNKEYINNSSNDSEKASEDITSIVTQPFTEKYWNEDDDTKTNEADDSNINGENTSIANRNFEPISDNVYDDYSSQYIDEISEAITTEIIPDTTLIYQGIETDHVVNFSSKNEDSTLDEDTEQYPSNEGNKSQGTSEEDTEEYNGTTASAIEDISVENSFTAEMIPPESNGSSSNSGDIEESQPESTQEIESKDNFSATRIQDVPAEGSEDEVYVDNTTKGINKDETSETDSIVEQVTGAPLVDDYEETTLAILTNSVVENTKTYIFDPNIENVDDSIKISTSTSEGITEYSDKLGTLPSNTRIDPIIITDEQLSDNQSSESEQPLYLSNMEFGIKENTEEKYTDGISTANSLIPTTSSAYQEAKGLSDETTLDKTEYTVETNIAIEHTERMVTVNLISEEMTSSSDATFSHVTQDASEINPDNKNEEQSSTTPTFINGEEKNTVEINVDNIQQPQNLLNMIYVSTKPYPDEAVVDEDQVILDSTGQPLTTPNLISEETKEGRVSSEDRVSHEGKNAYEIDIENKNESIHQTSTTVNPLYEETNVSYDDELLEEQEDAVEINVDNIEEPVTPLNMSYVNTKAYSDETALQEDQVTFDSTGQPLTTLNLVSEERKEFSEDKVSLEDQNDYETDIENENETIYQQSTTVNSLYEDTNTSYDDEFLEEEEDAVEINVDNIKEPVTPLNMSYANTKAYSDETVVKEDQVTFDSTRQPLTTPNLVSEEIRESSEYKVSLKDQSDYEIDIKNINESTVQTSTTVNLLYEETNASYDDELSNEEENAVEINLDNIEEPATPLNMSYVNTKPYSDETVVEDQVTFDSTEQPLTTPNLVSEETKESYEDRVSFEDQNDYETDIENENGSIAQTSTTVNPLYEETNASYDDELSEEDEDAVEINVDNIEEPVTALNISYVNTKPYSDERVVDEDQVTFDSTEQPLTTPNLVSEETKESSEDNVSFQDQDDYQINIKNKNESIDQLPTILNPFKDSVTEQQVTFEKNTGEPFPTPTLIPDATKWTEFSEGKNLDEHQNMSGTNIENGNEDADKYFVIPKTVYEETNKSFDDPLLVEEHTVETRIENTSSLNENYENITIYSDENNMKEGEPTYEENAQVPLTTLNWISEKTEHPFEDKVLVGTDINNENYTTDQSLTTLYPIHGNKTKLNEEDHTVKTNSGRTEQLVPPLDRNYENTKRYSDEETREDGHVTLEKNREPLTTPNLLPEVTKEFSDEKVLNKDKDIPKPNTEGFHENESTNQSTPNPIYEETETYNNKSLHEAEAGIETNVTNIEQPQTTLNINYENTQQYTEEAVEAVTFENNPEEMLTTAVVERTEELFEVEALYEDKNIPETHTENKKENIDQSSTTLHVIYEGTEEPFNKKRLGEKEHLTTQSTRYAANKDGKVVDEKQNTAEEERVNEVTGEPLISLDLIVEGTKEPFIETIVNENNSNVDMFDGGSYTTYNSIKIETIDREFIESISFQNQMKIPDVLPPQTDVSIELLEIEPLKHTATEIVIENNETKFEEGVGVSEATFNGIVTPQYININDDIIDSSVKENIPDEISDIISGTTGFVVPNRFLNISEVTPTTENKVLLDVETSVMPVVKPTEFDANIKDDRMYAFDDRFNTSKNMFVERIQEGESSTESVVTTTTISTGFVTDLIAVEVSDSNEETSLVFNDTDRIMEESIVDSRESATNGSDEEEYSDEEDESSEAPEPEDDELSQSDEDTGEDILMETTTETSVTIDSSTEDVLTIPDSLDTSEEIDYFSLNMEEQVTSTTEKVAPVYEHTTVFEFDTDKFDSSQSNEKSIDELPLSETVRGIVNPNSIQEEYPLKGNKKRCGVNSEKLVVQENSSRDGVRNYASESKLSKALFDGPKDEDCLHNNEENRTTISDNEKIESTGIPEGVATGVENTDLPEESSGRVGEYIPYIQGRVFDHDVNFSIKITVKETTMYVPSTAYLLQDVENPSLNITWTSSRNSVNNYLFLSLTQISKYYIINGAQLNILKDGEQLAWKKNVVVMPEKKDRLKKYDWEIEFEDGVNVLMTNIDFLQVIEENPSKGVDSGEPSEASEQKDEEDHHIEIAAGSMGVVILVGLILFLVISKARARALRKREKANQHVAV